MREPIQQKKPKCWEAIKTTVSHNFWFYCLAAIAVGLLITSFLLPPLGIIDNSVLAAAGELFAFAALGTLVHAIDRGKSAKVTHGDTTLEVGDKVNEHEY